MNIVTLLEVLVKGLNEAEEKFFENIKDFYSFETAVKGATESFAASYLGAVLSSIDEQISKDAWRKDKYNIQRHDTRTIISSVGDVTFDCTYYQSRENKKEYHYLLEELLGVSAHERFSEAAEEKILTEALKTSYEEATKVIPSKSKITKTTVMNKVHSIAKELPKEKPDKLKKVPYLFIEADEDHVAEQHGKWSKKEDNVGFISKLAYLYEYKQDSPKCKGRKELVNTFYFGGVYEAGKGVRKFWQNVFEYINDNYDYENINKIYIIGDGGAWIKSGVNYVPGSQFCADKFHLMKYINKASNQMLDEAEIAKEEIYRLLYKKRKKQLSEYIDEMINSANNPEPVEALKTFVLGNWDAVMRCLHNKIIQGCSAEGHVSHVLSDRLSSRPRGWSKTGADRMSKLICYEKNYGREKIIELVKYSREQRKLKRTGTDDLEVKQLRINELIRDHRNQSKKYIDTVQATVPGMTSRKIFNIRNQIRLI